MDTGPNPKFIFQGLILLVGILIFAATVLVLKVRSGKDFKAILADHKRLQTFSLVSALILFIVLFVIILFVKRN
jgi:hypothetical protein